MVKKIAAFIVAPTWHKVMVYGLQKYSSTSDTFPAPAPNPTKDSLPPVLNGNWNTDASRGVHDILYWVQKDNPTAGAPANPSSDPQFAYWEYPVQLWAAQGGNVPIISPGGSIPGTSIPSTSQGFQIISPQSGTTIAGASAVTVTAMDPSPQTITSVTYTLNGGPLGTASTPPYAITFLPTTRGPVVLQAVAKRTNGTSEVRSINFTIQ
jgi:hypothetical protein